jgi:hypothetical protein
MAEEEKVDGGTKPSGPKWLIAVAGFLALVVGIMASLDKIQSFMCHHGFEAFCPKDKVVIKIGSWSSDIGGGWKVVITNPTEYSAGIVNANLNSTVHLFRY